MIDYNYEYQYREYKQHPRKYRVPIDKNINNEEYKKEQLEFIRKLFPNGL